VPEATERLKPLYAKQLKDSSLSLTVRYYAPGVFFVDGAVVKPGRLRSSLPLTLERAVTEAGGIKAGAQTGQVLIIRRDAEGQVHAYQEALAPTAGASDPVLSSFDVVYVPFSPIGAVNDFLANYAKTLPFSVTTQVPAPSTTIPPQQLTH
jgi:protein involved in polysaccharide export with SLBB domain